ncbi:DUF2735 domain-containing protein [Xanthobacter dioxanivorans]|uniref:DUF2735 domain-containing protein n=1 Tax=Xanthobacter dioxanivorans TaxID=2528964 RepID=A0A974PPV1_9HYPH|nr:DUF2735 domain-containing protein [Xanthobacter dioxanivorans]QRG07129.1 DUF2735 domain-containing protein [Xanthobacter dioxanivorans]
MTANQKPETAKIYIFPVKNGATFGMPAKEAKWAAELAAVGAAHAAIGSSWYHEEAVKADDRPRRR